MTEPNTDTFANDAVLRDGGSVLIRAAVPPDKPRVREFFEKLGEVSNRNRFFALRRNLPEAELDQMTTPIGPSGRSSSLASAAATAQ